MASNVRLNDGGPDKMKRADQRASITVLVLGDGKSLLPCSSVFFFHFCLRVFQNVVLGALE